MRNTQAKLYKNASYLQNNLQYIDYQAIKNIIQIRNLQGITKRSMAEALDINEASYGRIESGKIALAYSMLAKIASVFNLSVVDVITYPDKFEKKEIIGEEPVEAILQIKLKKDKKDQVLKLVFGDNNIEILNK